MPKTLDPCLFCDSLPCVCGKKEAAPKKKVFVKKQAPAKPVEPEPDPTPRKEARRMSLEQMHAIREDAEMKRALLVLAPILHPQEQTRHGLPSSPSSTAERSEEWKKNRGQAT